MKTLAAVLWLWSVQALAQGVVLSPSQLPVEARRALQAQVEAARKSDPAAFEALAQVRASLPALDAQKRGSQPVVSPILKDLGPKALAPIISELAFTARPRGELGNGAWQAWRLALIEVLGEQQSAAAAPVFLTILRSAESDFELNRLAAAALGSRNDDEAARALVTLSAGPKREAVLAGMGACRRPVIAQTLAQAVSTTNDAKTLTLLSKSLGVVGNSWAWRTLPAGEGQAVRATAARALLQAFVKSDGHARQAASNALMVVDAPETIALIREAKKTVADAAALTALEQRFAKNPARL